MKKSKYIIIISTLVFLSLMSLSAIAHPPQGMTLDYDYETKTLDVTITHNTPGPTVHYINKVDIELNDEIYLSEEYDSQPTTDIFTYSYSHQPGWGFRGGVFGGRFVGQSPRQRPIARAVRIIG